jgi:hypothetical protein
MVIPHGERCSQQTVEYATFTHDREGHHFFDDEISKDCLSASQALSGAVNLIADYSADEKRLIILWEAFFIKDSTATPALT